MHGENREDCFVWDEPLYAYYLQQTGIDHPGAKQIIEAGECDWRAVVKRCISEASDGLRIHFQKHMTHHVLPEMDRQWLHQLRNCFLIRDPREVIASYARVRPQVSLEDVGITQQAQLFDFLASTQSKPPLVVDARDILQNPASMLTRMCESLGVEFSAEMLSWPAGPRDSDGLWSQFWYSSVERSTGFEAYVEKSHRISEQLRPLAQQCMRDFERLYALRLQP